MFYRPTNGQKTQSNECLHLTWFTINSKSLKSWPHLHKTRILSNIRSVDTQVDRVVLSYFCENIPVNNRFLGESPGIRRALGVSNNGLKTMLF